MTAPITPDPARVDDDEPPRAGQPAEESLHDRVFPVELEVRDPALEVDEVRLTLAEDLVGDGRVSVPGELRLGMVAHAPSAPGREPIGIASG